MNDDLDIIECSDLVSKIIRGDSSAEDILCQKFKLKLELLVRRKLSDFCRGLDDAHGQDVVQECWLAVIENLRKGALRDPANLPAYICRIARNKVNDAIDEYRERNKTVLTDDLPAPDPQCNPHKLGTKQQKIFDRIINKLKPREKAILELRACHNWTYACISKLLGISEDNCKKIFQRAKEHARKIILEID